MNTSKYCTLIIYNPNATTSFGYNNNFDVLPFVKGTYTEMIYQGTRAKIGFPPPHLISLSF